jgi:hypothetical protein
MARYEEVRLPSASNGLLMERRTISVVPTDADFQRGPGNFENEHVLGQQQVEHRNVAGLQKDLAAVLLQRQSWRQMKSSSFVACAI